MNRRMVTTVAVSAVLGAALAGGYVLAVSAETPAEAAFRAARQWTVRVEVTIPVPFIEDEQASMLGSGLVVDAARGWVLTNAHVAGHSPSELKIAFADSKLIPAQRVYVDPEVDLAVIAYRPAQLRQTPPVAELECDALPPVGHPVGAYGHPWGFRFTGTRGITSGVTSRFGPDMLQTDAPINEGNSGGPLISLETGRVVGVNTAKIADEKVEGLSFAVPIRSACRLLALLREGKDPSPPAPGLDFATDENDTRTLVVAHSRLPAGSPALQLGDEIIAVGRQAVSTPSEFTDALRGHLDDVALTVRRGAAEVALKGRFAAAPRITARVGLWVDGALFASMDDFNAGTMGDDIALMVHHVEPASEAEGTGLEAYDMLVRVDGRPVHSIGELEQAIAHSKRDDRQVELMLLRLMDDGRRLVEYERRYLGTADVHRVGGG